MQLTLMGMEISILFQGKTVGPFRWAAVVLGFVGAVMVIRPDPSALDPIAKIPEFKACAVNIAKA